MCHLSIHARMLTTIFMPTWYLVYSIVHVVDLCVFKLSGLFGHTTEIEEDCVRGEVLHSGWVIEPFDRMSEHPCTTDYRAGATPHADENEEETIAQEETESRESVYCTYVLCVDPKGMVPNWVVNMFRTRDVLASFLRLKVLAEEGADV